MRLSNRTLVAAAAVVLGVTGLVLPASSAGAASSPIQLLVPQGTAFSVLGYDCGGIGENAYATGFDSTIDPLAGYPTGDVFLTTTCSAGKGTHFTVSVWTSDTWDLTGALLSVLGSVRGSHGRPEFLDHRPADWQSGVQHDQLPLHHSDLDSPQRVPAAGVELHAQAQGDRDRRPRGRLPAAPA